MTTTSGDAIGVRDEIGRWLGLVAGAASAAEREVAARELLARGRAEGVDLRGLLESLRALPIAT
jgi:hypothetical protein